MALKSILLTDTSPAAAIVGAAGAGVADNLENIDQLQIDALLLGATGGTLDVYLQRWVQKLQEWRDWAHFPQLAAGAAAIRYSFGIGFTSTGITVVGAQLVPALALNTVALAHPGTKLRLLYAAGASTSAGAVQKVEISGWRRR